MAGHRTFGRYEVTERLGRGGMGVVYRCNDPLLGREVAIKVLSPDLLVDQRVRTTFTREARALAALQHSNVVTVHEFGEEDGAPFMVMEFLRGCDLARRLRVDPPLTFNQKLAAITDVCAGLSAAHSVGVVHFDVKPSNIWLLPDGRVKLIDFGIAVIVTTTSVHHSGPMGGSPAYMAPERLTGEIGDGRADIFSLGVVAYELFGGRRPFEGENAAALMYRVLHDKPPSLDTLAPDLPEPLVRAIELALEKDPERRFRTADELCEVLRTVPSLAPTVIVPPPATDLHLEYDKPLEYDEPHLLKSDYTPSIPTPHRFDVTQIAGLLFVVAVVAFLAWQAVRPRPTTVPAAPAPTPLAQTAKAEQATPTRVTIQSDPPGARVLVNGEAIDSLTPATIDIAPDNLPKVSLELAGFRRFDGAITSEHLANGAFEAALERIPRARVRLEGAYDFEVWGEGQRLSPRQRLHDLNLPIPSAVWLRAPDYLLDERVAVNSSQVTQTAPALAQVRLQVPGALETCPTTISRAGSTSRSTTRRFDEPPASVLSLVAGQYRIEIACESGLRSLAVVQLPAGQNTTARMTFAGRPENQDGLADRGLSHGLQGAAR